MFKRFGFALLLVFPCLGGDPRAISTIKGMVSSSDSLVGNHLMVSLIDTVAHKNLERTFVAGDGSFEFHEVIPGSYAVELTAQSGDSIFRENIAINSSADLMRGTGSRPVSATRPANTEI